MHNETLKNETVTSVEGKRLIIPAVTPLTKTYRLDKTAVEKIFAALLRQGAAPFILGTTGESASLSLKLKRTYIKEAGKRKGHAFLYAGISSNCFEETVDLAAFGFDNGADAVVATLPAYYALTPDQVKKYFIMLADAISGPLVIYNIPSTTHMSIPVAIVDELSHHPGIVAIKDSEKDDDRLQQSLALWKDRNDFGHYLGWAARSADALFHGSDGLVPSTGNLVPEIYATMIRAVAEGRRQDADRMQELSDAYGNLYQSGRTLGESLWALKLLMSQEKLCKPFVLPPLSPQTETEAASLKKAFREMKEKNLLKR